jgi:murein DD-endopeptidase MepM/ murein hydrolase activator NlpD
MAGRVAGVAAGLIALFSFSVPAHAQAGATGGAGSTVPPDPITQPGTPATGTTGGSGASAPARAPSRARPVLTIFTASAAAASSGAVVQFRVSDRDRSVRVRLAFVNQADRRTYRVNLGRRRTGMTHTYSWGRRAPAGSYRVRITARNRRGRKAVRSTTIQVSPAAPAATTVGAHRFPIAGAYSWGGKDGRFGAPRSGHIHQGQDVAAAQGTPLVAVVSGTIYWRAFQASGAGYYLVLDADNENFNYVYMHLQEGSLLVGKGDRVTIGQRIANVGNTGGSEGPHLHFEVWDGPWYAGGQPVDPYPFLKSWE